MKVEKAFILRIDDDRSQKYAKTAADSCEKVGLPWEYFDGFSKTSLKGTNIWDACHVKFNDKKPKISGNAAFATAGHFCIWQKIVDQDICGIVLEHDALMLHKPTIDIPDDHIVVLGYKVKDPQNYAHEIAGPPSTLVERKKHGGAHAYAITPETAKKLLHHVKENDRVSYIDNYLFLTPGNRDRYKIKMALTDPICAIGWLRESTIWGKSAVDNYGPILDSFKDYYNSKEDMGVKK
jgi:GR25 family glycosyltransferase involved in LPS biosynthesis